MHTEGASESETDSSQGLDPLSTDLVSAISGRKSIPKQDIGYQFSTKSRSNSPAKLSPPFTLDGSCSTELAR